MRLWDKIKDEEVGVYCTDYWKSYQQFLPDYKHVISKSETYTVEGYNSIIRHKLARFKRKTKCYSKSQSMIEGSLKLLMNQWNNKKTIPI